MYTYEEETGTDQGQRCLLNCLLQNNSPSHVNLIFFINLFSDYYFCRYQTVVHFLEHCTYVTPNE